MGSLEIVEVCGVTSHLHARGKALVSEALSNPYLVLQKALDEYLHVVFFTVPGADGLRGFLCYEMFSDRAELHIRFVWVPKVFRGSGFGVRIMRWVISKASRIAQTKCRWISLKAAGEELVPFYERFGFVDMTCGPDHLGHISMEMQSKSAALP